MKRALVFGADRTGYGIEQVERPLTVGQLRELLEDLDDDMIVICSHDNGYTYGSLSHGADIMEESEGEYGPEWETVDEVSCW